MFAMLDFCLPNILGIVGDMENGPDWARLAGFVRRARGTRSRKEIADAGGPSDTTLAKIETDTWRPNRGVTETLEKLDNGLRWAPGTAAAILDGGTPVPTSDSGADFAVQTPEGVIFGQVKADTHRRRAPLIFGDTVVKILLDAVNDPEFPADPIAREELRSIIEAIQQTNRSVAPLLDQPAVTRSYIDQMQKLLLDAKAIIGRAASDEPPAPEVNQDPGGENVVRPAHWDEAPLPPPVDLSDAASVGTKQSDEFVEHLEALPKKLEGFPGAVGQIVDDLAKAIPELDFRGDWQKLDQLYGGREGFMYRVTHTRALTDLLGRVADAIEEHATDIEAAKGFQSIIKHLQEQANAMSTND